MRCAAALLPFRDLHIRQLPLPPACGAPVPWLTASWDGLVRVRQDELKRRRAGWEAPADKYSCGVLHKYSKLVNSASQGATLAREHSGSLFRNR